MWFDEPIRFTNDESSFLNAVSASILDLTNASASITDNKVTITLDPSHVLPHDYETGDLAISSGELEDLSGNDFSVTGEYIYDGWTETVTNVTYTDATSGGSDATDIKIAFDDIAGSVDETQSPHRVLNYYVAVFADGTTYENAAHQISDNMSSLYNSGAAEDYLAALDQLVSQNRLKEIPATSGDDGVIAALPSNLTTFNEVNITQGNYEVFVLAVDHAYWGFSISENYLNVEVGD
ncbi:hypothetical protein [Pontibacillus marinus]|uniref:Uncharacterized protein n=1 Tax=Pontibacillus marinus BH030004 = DSM 16465 TaxID=1385511 RepID=A0A0A5GIS7_9BACI|nr:hypothetical protein [Pontibacillus marinus]KGX91030.1 hypothetical protein N783_13410 [Pontibacillus marinus BH030004 = DSM 16465]